MLAVALPAFASSITWGTPVNDTGNASDVATDGAFFASALANPASTTVNGVTFENVAAYSSGTLSFNGGSGITMTNVECYPSTFAVPPSSYSAAYQTMVLGEGYANVSLPAVQIVIGGLTFGDEYEVELLSSYWNDNWMSTFTDGLGNTVELNNGTNGTAAVTPSADSQFVSGTFIADSSTETITMSSESSYEILPAVEVRDLGTGQETPSTPEPATLLLLGSGLLAIARRFRRQ